MSFDTDQIAGGISALASYLPDIVRSYGFSIVLFLWIMYMLKRMDEMRVPTVLLVSAFFIWFMRGSLGELAADAPDECALLAVAYAGAGWLGDVAAQRDSRFRRKNPYL